MHTHILLHVTFPSGSILSQVLSVQAKPLTKPETTAPQSSGDALERTDAKSRVGKLLMVWIYGWQLSGEEGPEIHN